MAIENPLDALFGTAPSYNDDVVEYEQTTEGALVQAEPIDHDDLEDDRETDRKMDAIYNLALETFSEQTAMVQIMEPRYSARNAEVAAQYLNIALSAIQGKAKVKTERKKAGAAATAAAKPGATNVVVASREEIMRMISVDAEVKSI